MVTDPPDAADLLGIAREVLLDELLPALPKSHAYSALMLANAMAMVARECAAPADADAAVDRAARVVYGERIPDPIDTDLARRIRDRQLDPDDPALRRLLLEQTLSRLRLSNPKYLTSYDSAALPQPGG